jgi:lysophospholipase L1-like esterase
MLDDVNYSADLDFVGSERAGFAVQPPIDPDNEGHPGWTSYQIAAHVYNWLVKNPADIVLLHIGTNDGIDSADGVRQVLDEIDRYEEDNLQKVHVFVALIIDRQQHSPTIAQFNQNLKGLVEERIADDDNLTLVDMYHGAGLNSGDYLEDTHPNKQGYAKMAKVWFDALMKYKADLLAAGEIAPDE